MQDKGIKIFFTILLALICVIFLSLTLTINGYYKQAKEYAGGNEVKESHYLDSLASKKFGLWYILKKGKMDVIMEFNTADFMKSLPYNNPDSVAELRSAIDNSLDVLRYRLDLLGIAHPDIQKLQDGRISIKLSGVNEKDRERVRTLLQADGKFEFWETFDEKDIQQDLWAANNIIRDSLAKVQEKPIPAKNDIPASHPAVKDSVVEQILTQIEKSNSDLQEKSEKPVIYYMKNYPLFYLLNFDPQQPRQGPIIGTVHKRDMELVNLYFNMRQVQESLPRQLVVRWSAKPVDEENKDMFYLYALKASDCDGRPAMDGDVIITAKDEISYNSPYTEISITMNPKGAKEWARLTKDNIGKCIAIVLDNKVYCAPFVNSEILNGISVISGRFTSEEAKDLANLLRSGQMPVTARIVQEDITGASLEQNTINIAFITSSVAALIFIACLIFVYGIKPNRKK